MCSLWMRNASFISYDSKQRNAPDAVFIRLFFLVNRANPLERSFRFAITPKRKAKISRSRYRTTYFLNYGVRKISSDVAKFNVKKQKRKNLKNKSASKARNEERERERETRRLSIKKNNRRNDRSNERAPQIRLPTGTIPRITVTSGLSGQSES